jgi:translation elongation factor EF-Tu-like GTPase
MKPAGEASVSAPDVSHRLMSSAFLFYDELRPAGNPPIRVLARIRMLTEAEGGRGVPARGRYRPNHNFGTPENRHYFIGQVEIPEGELFNPGETRELTITFLNVVGLAEELTPGRHWRIQEGARLVAAAEVLAILSGPDDRTKTG